MLAVFLCDSSFLLDLLDTARHSEGRCPVYAAAAKGHTAVIQALHSAKADIDRRDWCADVAPLSDSVLLLLFLTGFLLMFLISALFSPHTRHTAIFKLHYGLQSTRASPPLQRL